MTITLGACFNTETSESEAGICIAPSDTSGWPAMAWCDTHDEAKQAKRAFENVLLPRFTRDEAIALMAGVLEVPCNEGEDWSQYRAGIRAALEALAAAGVFSDAPGPDGRFVGETMADKLDAAGIR